MTGIQLEGMEGLMKQLCQSSCLTYDETVLASLIIKPGISTETEEQWNTTEIPELYPHSYSQFIFDKRREINAERKDKHWEHSSRHRCRQTS